jgi:hypothetical protein
MKSLFYIFILLAPRLTLGQTGCHVDKLTGEWKYVIAGHMGKITNIDSLKELANNSNEIFETLHFREDGMFSFKNTHSKKFRLYKPFTYNKGTCEIILGTKKDAEENANLEIVFFDYKYLIYWEDNNPKTYYTHVAVKVAQ